MDDKEFTYVLEAYKTCVTYFNSFINRVSTRFNILISIDIALAGIYSGLWLNPTKTNEMGTYLIASLGIIISIMLYFQSAQDRFLIKRQQDRINKIREKLEEAVNRKDIPALFSGLDDTDSGKKMMVFEGITSWRSNFISVSQIPSVTSLIFVAFWTISLFVKNMKY
jgi:hypothetical protein